MLIGPRQSPTWRPGWLCAGNRIRFTAIAAAIGGRGDVGVAGLGTQFHTRAEAAIRTSTSGKVLECAPLMREAKMVKAGADVSRLRTASELAMRSIDAAAKRVHVGMSHRDIAQRFDVAARTEGAELTVVLVGAGAISGQPPTTALVRQEDHSSVFLEVSVDGYWVEHSTILNFTRSPGSRDRSASVAVEFLQRAASTMVVGNRASDVADCFEASDVADCFEREFRRARVRPTMGLGHGVGVDEDWPIIVADDLTVLQENMVITLHPSFVGSDGEGSAVADTFHIGVGGARPLVRSGPRIVDVVWDSR